MRPSKQLHSSLWPCKKFFIYGENMRCIKYSLLSVEFCGHIVKDKNHGSVIVVCQKDSLELNVNDVFQQDLLLARPCRWSILGHARKQRHASSCAVCAWYVLALAASVMTSMFLWRGRVVEDRQQNKHEERVATAQVWSLAIQETWRCSSQCVLRW